MRRQSVERVIEAPAAEVFALLRDPARHHEIDGSGTVHELVHGAPIDGVGQRFRMAMDRPGRADYRSDNIVTLFEPGAAIGWATTDVDEGDLGYRWSFRLRADGPARTVVTHTYDWSGVTDPALLARFPQVSTAEMAQTLEALARALR